MRALFRILIVSPDPSDLLVLAQTLEGQGYEAAAASPGEASALAQADLVLLDLRGGWEEVALRSLLRQAQDSGQPAFLAIAILRPEQLPHYDPALGIDDFIAIPATPAEVEARLRHNLWRRSRVDARHMLKLGDMVMDLANYKVFVAGREVDLTYKEFELLRFLAQNRGKTFNREAILNRVWGYDYFGGARTVDVHIRRLRSKVEAFGHTLIETVRGVGYRFTA
ncbi:MAG TPA: response regulator transcription factor [Dehalococcoidia bacterium]|nr:response regulator transcription factor [Dehalococcoidia bacterium]